MKTIKISENGVTHFPIVLTLSTDYVLYSYNGYTASTSDVTKVPHGGKVIRNICKGSQIVKLACKAPAYLQNKGSLRYACRNDVLLSEVIIEDGEVTCKNCLKVLGLVEKHSISDGYLYARVCAFSKEYKAPNGSLTPHLLDAKFYRREANALAANTAYMYQSLSGDVITRSDYAKLSIEDRNLYLVVRIQNTKYEIVKIKLSVEGKI